MKAIWIQKNSENNFIAEIVNDEKEYKINLVFFICSKPIYAEKKTQKGLKIVAVCTIRNTVCTL